MSVDDDRLRIRFGLWTLETSLDNILGVEITGPYKWFKVIGPPHVSLADRGLTLATIRRLLTGELESATAIAQK